MAPLAWHCDLPPRLEIGSDKGHDRDKDALASRSAPSSGSVQLWRRSLVPPGLVLPSRPRASSDSTPCFLPTDKNRQHARLQRSGQLLCACNTAHAIASRHAMLPTMLCYSQRCGPASLTQLALCAFSGPLASRVINITLMRCALSTLSLACGYFQPHTVDTTSMPNPRLF